MLLGSLNRFRNITRAWDEANAVYWYIAVGGSSGGGIKFLELTLDTIGFSLGKMTITWDRVSFFIVLLLTLVGVFAENAFLK